MFKIGGFFLFVLVLSLVATLPMPWFYQQLKSDADLVVLENVQGTLWSGSAAIKATTLAPPYSAENWHWDFNPLSLLRGQLSWQLFWQPQQPQQPQQNLDLYLGTSMFGFGNDYHLTLNSNLSALVAIHPVFSLISGSLSAQLQDFDSLNCIDNSGEIQLLDLKLLGFELQQLTIQIGCKDPNTYQLDYVSDDPKTQLKGRLEIDLAGNYHAKTTVNSEHADIVEQLAGTASKKLSKGSFLFISHGNLNEL